MPDVNDVRGNDPVVFRSEEDAFAIHFEGKMVKRVDLMCKKWGKSRRNLVATAIRLMEIATEAKDENAVLMKMNVDGEFVRVEVS